jgi:hypothetical protein
MRRQRSRKKPGLKTGVRVKLVEIARKIGVVADVLRFVLLTAWPRAGNDRLQLAYLAVMESIGSLPEIVRKSARKRQFIKRVNPVCPQIVGLPIGVNVRLLEGIVRPHALVNWDDIRLHIGKVVFCAREVRRPSVDSEDVARHIVAGAHSLQYLGVALGNRSELCVAVLARSRNIGDRDVVDHPPFIPAALVVDDEQRRNVSEDTLKARGLFGSVGSPGFGLQDNTHGANSLQSAIRAGDGQLHVVIHAGEYGGKDVGLETGRVQQVILEQLTGPVGFGERILGD